MSADGFVSAGQAVSVDGGADYVRTAAAQPGQDEGNQDDLQVRLKLAADMAIPQISITSLWIYLKETQSHTDNSEEDKSLSIS